MGEFGVSDKEETKKSSISASTTITTSNVLGLGGVKVQQLQQQHNLEEAFPSSNKTMMMMVHHNHHHRPLSPFDGDGPTTTQDTSLTNHQHHHHNINPPLSGGVPAPLGAVRNLQPFHNNIISAYTPATTTTTRSAFKSPGAGGMAASLGFPFTSAQWKELERQAMIYKYMMASVPVPPDLLIPTSLTTASSRSPLDDGFNLRLSSSTDPEPGRCRRTDGKKWRCSRDVAPNHKYCERHMHRGRPRSRKPVEVHTNNTNSIATTTINSSINSYQQIKRARHDCDPFPTSGVTVAISNPTTRRDGSSTHFFAASTATTQPYLESSLSLDNFGVKATNFDSVVSSVSSNKEPRGLDWMLNGDPISLGASESEWHSLMHNRVGLDAMSSCSDAEPHYLNSFALYSSGLEQQNRRPATFLNPLLVPMENLQSERPPRGFIDAWSNASTEQSNGNNKNSVAPIGKLSLSSLDLSMGGGSGHEDIDTNEVGLGLIEHDGNSHNVSDTKSSLYNWLTPAPWVASTPGGPLAEVLRPSTVTATNNAAASNSNPSSPIMTHAESNSSPLGGTVVSSPSGVLHKAVASLSDSSSNSSPTVASSRANSEIALLRFNQK